MKILISGSSSGIGRAVAEKLLSQRHTVIGLARRHEKFQPALKDYRTYTVDFSEINILEGRLKDIANEHTDIDAIICCAGFGYFAELEQFSVRKMQEILHVNFLSQAVLIKTFLAGMKARCQGKIILLGSESALQGARKGSLYCAAKFALRGFAQSLRQECGRRNIAVSLINPGLVDTAFFDALEFTPGAAAENSIQPEQIAELIINLLQMQNNCVVEEINLQPLKKVVCGREKS